MPVQNPEIKEEWMHNINLSSNGTLTAHRGENLHVDEVRHSHMHYQMDHRKLTSAMFDQPIYPFIPELFGPELLCLNK